MDISVIFKRCYNDISEKCKYNSKAPVLLRGAFLLKTSSNFVETMVIDW